MAQGRSGPERGDQNQGIVASSSPKHLVRKQLRTPKAAAIAGIIFALLFATAITLVRLSMPTDPSKAGSWLADSGRKSLVSVAFNLVPFAGIAFLWFIGVIRDRLGEFEDRLFSTVFLGSGLLFVAMLFSSVAISTGLISSFDAAPATGAESAIWEFGRRMIDTMVNAYAIRMAAVFMITTCTVAHHSAIINRWLIYLGFPAALLLLFTASAAPWLMLLFPFWIFLVSIDILINNLRAQRESPGS